MTETDCEGATLAELARGAADEQTSVEMVESALARLVALGLVVECPHHPDRYVTSAELMRELERIAGGRED